MEFIRRSIMYKYFCIVYADRFTKTGFRTYSAQKIKELFFINIYFSIDCTECFYSNTTFLLFVDVFEN